MDKSWIPLGRTSEGRLSQQYFDGVMAFINFAITVMNRKGEILCPCTKCVNYYLQKPQIVQIHLLRHGIMQTYTIWDEHGESHTMNESFEMTDNEVVGGIDALVEDRIRGEPTDTHGEEVPNFDKLLNDANREVYPSCQNYSLLKFVIEILNFEGYELLGQCIN